MLGGNGLKSALRRCSRSLPSLALWPIWTPALPVGAWHAAWFYTELLRGFPLTAKLSLSSLAGLPGVPAWGTASRAFPSPHASLPRCRKLEPASGGFVAASVHVPPWCLHPAFLST